jgi:hypothetical protein
MLAGSRLITGQSYEYTPFPSPDIAHTHVHVRGNYGCGYTVDPVYCTCMHNEWSLCKTAHLYILIVKSPSSKTAYIIIQSNLCIVITGCMRQPPPSLLSLSLTPSGKSPYIILQVIKPIARLATAVTVEPGYIHMGRK